VPGHRLLGLGDLLIDALQRPLGPVRAVLVEDLRFRGSVLGPITDGWTKICPSPIGSPGCLLRHWLTCLDGSFRPLGFDRT
jgi:hypothetical protein